MKLLQTEIDIEPGRDPSDLPLPADGTVGLNIAVVRITNDTDRNNAHTICLQCDNPFWQDRWVVVASHNPPSEDEQLQNGLQPDMPGPNNRSLTISQLRHSSRDVLILFSVPMKSEARAGIYHLVVKVETRVDGHGADRGRNRVSMLHAVAVVRPFHDWSAVLAPMTRNVGFFWRRASFELEITNKGNDWLYCALARQPDRPDDRERVRLQAARLAVPPPEPGQESVRTTPIHARCHGRIFKGDRVPRPVPFTVTRVDAPTVAPLPRKPAARLRSAGCFASVVATTTGEVREPGDNRADPKHQPVLDCPLIHPVIAGCVGALTRNAMTLMAGVIGMIVAVVLFIHMWQMLLYHDIQAYPCSLSAERRGCLKFAGKWLSGARVFMRLENEPNAWKQLSPCDANAPTEEERKRLPRGFRDSLLDAPRGLLGWLRPNTMQHIGALIPADIRYEGRNAFFKVKRGGGILFIGPMLPDHECPTAVAIGKKPEPARPVVAPVFRMDPVAVLGKPFLITGESLTESGQIWLGARECRVLNWTPERIEVRAPDGVAVGKQYQVNARLIDGRNCTVGPLTFEQPATGQPGPAGGAGGGGPSAGKPGSGSVGSETAAAPREPSGLAQRAYAALLDSRRSDARSLAERAVAQNPDDALALAVAGYTLLREAKVEEAREVIRRAHELTKGATGRARAVTLTAQGWLDEQDGDRPAAETKYGGAISADLTCALAYLNYTYFLLDSNRRFEARQYVRSGLNEARAEARGSSRYMELAGKLNVR